MKFYTTKKQMKSNYRKILSIGYCELQTLLDSQSPIAYSSGTYGWACDYYDIDGVIISTGYIPIGDKVDYKLTKEYEQKARDIRSNSKSGSWEEYQKIALPLIKEFIAKAVSK